MINKNFRLKTSKFVEERLKQLQSVTNITPNILARIAVSLSLKEHHPVKDVKIEDSNGIEFNRHTLTGEYDYFYKTLIAQNEGSHINDSLYFPGLFNKHLERGVRLLSNEYQYAGNYEKLIVNLLNKY